VKADFNYERQPQVIVTVKAVDTSTHVSYAQITVNVTDINDEKPELHMVTSNGSWTPLSLLVLSAAFNLTHGNRGTGKEGG
jgi:hypothetical protein